MKRAMVAVLATGLVLVGGVAHATGPVTDCATTDRGDRSTTVVRPETTSYTLNVFLTVDGNTDDPGVHLTDWTNVWFVDAGASGVEVRLDGGTGKKYLHAAASPDQVCAALPDEGVGVAGVVS